MTNLDSTRRPQAPCPAASGPGCTPLTWGPKWAWAHRPLSAVGLQGGVSQPRGSQCETHPETPAPDSETTHGRGGGRRPRETIPRQGRGQEIQGSKLWDHPWQRRGQETQGDHPWQGGGDRRPRAPDSKTTPDRGGDRRSRALQAHEWVTVQKELKDQGPKCGATLKFGLN